MFYQKQLNIISRSVFFLLSLCFLYLSDYAQINEVTNVNSIHIDSKSGLPTNYVNYVFKDSYGFYWIGTQAGLCKYDGYKLYQFRNNPKDSFSLKCSNIFVIAQYQHYIIIGCEKGITFYDYYKDKFFKIKNIDKELDDTEVHHIFKLNHKLYIVSQKGFYEYNFKDSTLIPYLIKDGDTGGFTGDSRLFFNRYNFLISDMDKGIKKIDTLTHSIYGNIDFYNNQPRDMIQYGNIIYILYSSYGIVKVDAITLEKIGDIIAFRDIFRSNITGQYSLIQLKNNIYIGNKNGIVEYNPLMSYIKTLYIEEKNSNIQIRKLFNIDNNLIATTVSNGIYIIPYSVQKIINPVPDAINSKFSNTFAITEYHTGKILIGGNEKFYLYNLMTNNIEKDFSQLFKNTIILQITPSRRQNEVFVATYGRGLFQLNLETGKLKTLVNKGDYLSLFLNDDDTLWAGTLEKGLWKINVSTNARIPLKNFENETVNYIKKTADAFWIATASGLFKIDPKGNILLNFSTKNKKLSDNWVYHFTEDSNYIYIATDNGLTLFNKHDSTSKFFYDSDGLFSSTVLSVHLDKNGDLWIETLKGLTKMILSRINNPHLKLFYNYSYIEGLNNHEFDQNAHLLLKNGYLIYGGTSGLDIFNPLKIKPSFNSVPVYITSFKKSGKDYVTDTNIIFKRYFEIDWRQNNFQIEITAINPLGSSNILYKYKLDGYDEEFSAPSNIRYLSYTGLPGGVYKLEVYATNHDGEWNTTPYYVYIKVIPPFWKTTWFMISASVLVFGSIFGFNQYRTYQIKKRNRELEEKVEERTKELANKNREILSSIEYAKRIQQAILPTNKYIQSVLPNAFILYMPKDIVSGDFYWVYESFSAQANEKTVIIAVVDCTGHGVPGALMSMIGNNLLNQIVIEKNITSPDIILYEMNKGVQLALKQGQSDIQTNDGMDASVVRIFRNGTVEWAGAYRPIVIIRQDGTLEKIEGDKYPIGGVQMDVDRNYTLHTFQLNKGDMIYLFSDGYADQFGGEKGKKMMMKKFIQILSEIHLRPLSEQKEILTNLFKQWKSGHEQVDDVLVIGINYS